MELKLYHRVFCPYCRKVRDYLEESGRTDVELRDIGANKEDLEVLTSVGGKSQVPCLFIDGKPMYESEDIIQWLKANPQA